MSEQDYSKYSLKELLAVYGYIDKASANYEPLLAEFAARNFDIGLHQAQIDKQREAQQGKEFHIAQIGLKIAGFYQLATVCLLLFALAKTLVLGLEYEYANGAYLVIALVAVNALAAYVVLFERVRWFWLSIVNLVLQIPNFSVGELAWNYMGGASLGVTFSWLPQKINFGLNFHFLNTPSLTVSFLEVPAVQSFIAINLFVVFLVFAHFDFLWNRHKLTGAEVRGDKGD